MIAALVLTMSFVNCAKKDERTADRERDLRDKVAKEVAQYQSCEFDSDCTYSTEINGFVVSKAGLPYVLNCSNKLKFKIFPECKELRKQDVEFGMEPDQKSVPSSVACVNKRCEAVLSGKKTRNWLRENGTYLFKIKNREIDALCSQFLMEPSN